MAEEGRFVFHIRVICLRGVFIQLYISNNVCFNNMLGLAMPMNWRNRNPFDPSVIKVAGVGVELKSLHNARPDYAVVHKHTGCSARMKDI